MPAALTLSPPPPSALRLRRPLRRHVPRAALVQSRPAPAPVPSGGGGRGGGIGGGGGREYAIQLAAAADRADDMQAEAKALARAANATVYSPELLTREYGYRPGKVAYRALEILTSLGSYALGLFVDNRRGLLDSERRRKRAVELRKIFTRLGPTFVKIGQGLSTRPDICPSEFLEELAELQINKKLQQLKAPKKKQLLAPKPSVEGQGMVKYLAIGTPIVCTCMN